MSQYIENVDIVAKVKTTADTSGLTGDLKKVLEKPFKLELEADATQFLKDIKKDIAKIDDIIAKMDFTDELKDRFKHLFDGVDLGKQIADKLESEDFSGLTNKIQDAIKDGIKIGGGSLEETLVNLERKKDKLTAKKKELQLKENDSYLPAAEKIYNNLLAEAKKLNNEATLKKLEKYNPQKTGEHKSKLMRGSSAEWITAIEKELETTGLKNAIDSIRDDFLAARNEIFDSKPIKEMQLAITDTERMMKQLKDMHYAINHYDPATGQIDTDKAKKKIQDFESLMNQKVVSADKTPTFGDTMHSLYNTLQQGFDVEQKGFNVIGLDNLNAELTRFHKSLEDIISLFGSFKNESQFKNLIEVFEHLCATVDQLAASFQKITDSTIQPSAFYETEISHLEETLSGQNKAIDEANKNLRESYKERSEIYEDLASMQQAIAPSLTYDDEGNIISRKNTDTYNALKYIGNLTDKQKGSSKHLQYLPKAMSFLEQYLSLGGELADLDKKLNLTEDSSIIKNVRQTLDEREENAKNLTDQRDETLKNIAEQKKYAELARIAESANQPQDSADSTPLDLKVDEFNASLDSTSSHFEKLNAAISDTTNGLNKQDEKDGDQKIPNRLKQYSMTPGEFAGIHQTIEANAISLFEENGYDDMNLSIKQMANGLAKVTANLRDSNGEWKQFTAIADRAGKIVESNFTTTKPDAQSKLEKAWQSTTGSDQEEKVKLKLEDQIDQAQKLRERLDLQDTNKWSITVDDSGLVTIKNNLADVEEATGTATQKFKDFKDACDNFNKEVSKGTSVTLSNLKKELKETEQVSTDFINDILGNSKKDYANNYYLLQLESLKAYRDAGLYNRENYHNIVSDGYTALNKMYAITEGKSSISDFNESEIRQMIDLYEQMQKAIQKAGTEANKAQEQFGKLMDQSKLNTEATKMLDYLNRNSNAAEKYGDTIRKLAEQMRKAVTEIDFNKIKEQFTDVQYQISSEGLTGKLKGLTVSDANINKISSALETKSLDAKINKLKELYKMYSQVGLATSASLTGAMTNIDANFEALGQINISEASNDDLRSLVSHYNDLSDAIKLAENELKELQRTHGRVMSDSEKTIASNQISKWLQENSRAAKAYGETLERLAQQMKEVTTETEYKGIMSEFKAITSKAAAEGLLGRSIWDSFKNTFSHISEIFGSYSIVDVFQDLGRAGVENIRLIDASLTDLQMSARLSKNEAKEMMETYSQIGNDMAVLSTDLASATTSWIKQGESLENATKLAQDSTVLSVLGEMETEDAATYLTSALKGYQLASDQAMDVVDKISTVDIMSATSVGGLAEGMSEVATQANLVGISFDELLGYLAAIGEVTQDDMSSVGGALNTIFARMGNIKLGRLKDYQNDLETDLSNVETVLRGEGIDLRDEMGQFRDFNDVLNETAARWDSFSSISQNAIAQAFAGTHRRESFLVLMQNYQKAQQYAEASANSSGSAMERYGVYLDSLEARITKLQNAFQSLSTTVVNSDFAKGLVDAGTSVITMLDGLIEHVGSLNTIIGGFAIGKGIHSFVKNFDKSVYICKLG